MERVYNFNAGPSPMPLEVLEALKGDLTNFRNTGMGITEISHRSKEFQDMLDETKALVKKLMKLGDDYKVVFIQGGGNMQFLMTSMNFLKNKGAYLDTGVWTTKARKAASFFGETYEVASSKPERYNHIPKEFTLQPDTDYLYICVNNTVYGTEYHQIPDVDVPLIGDMSSDILSRELDYSKFDLIWAGIQKNLGAAGVALVVVKDDFLAKARTDIPDFLKYQTFVDSDSTYNTPPVFSIYTLNRMAHWIEDNGGLKGMEERNKKKADLLYNLIDESNGFYKGHAVKEDRSRMNVTFNLATPEMEADFVAKAKEQKFIGLKGHRLVGGIRASIYNAVTVETVEKLVAFMKEYQAQNQ